MVSNVMRRIACVSGLAIASSLLTSASVSAQVVTVNEASGAPGSTVEVVVNFAGEGSGASASNVDLGFEAGNPIDAAAGNPDCTVNPDIMKESTAFRFRPSGCTHGVDCTQARAGVISFNPANNATPIPDGVMFTCRFTIPSDAAIGDDFPINVDAASAVFPDGSEDDITAVSSGATINVVAVPTATSTPVDPTATSTPTRTNTPVPTNTTAPTNTRARGGGDDDDGCQVVAPANSSAGWLLLIPAAALLWQRRRSR